MKKILLGLAFVLAGSTTQAQDANSNNYKLVNGQLVKVETVASTNGLTGKPIPAFNFEDMEGNFIASESLKGKVVLINLWFTKCAPCIKEMPELNKLMQDYKNQDVVFLSIAPEDKPTIKKFLKKYKFDFPVLPKNINYIESISNVMPVNIIIDKNGIVRKYMGGIPVRMVTNANGERTETIDSSSIRASIDKLLTE
jgi:thiol-disulfide isomerase/thioredoxin